MEYKAKFRGAYKIISICVLVSAFLVVAVPLSMRDQLTFGHYVGFSVVLVMDLGFFGIFLYMSRTIGIRIENGNFIYKMLTTKVIPFSTIAGLQLERVLLGRNPTLISRLVIEDINGKKTKINIEFFENFEEILGILEKQSGRELKKIACV